jgi:peptide/nickel transport system permease protein
VTRGWNATREAPVSADPTASESAAALVASEPSRDDDKTLYWSQWSLTWWKFKQHKLAVVSGVLLIVFYLVAIFAEFFSTTDPHAYSSRYTYAPPQAVKLFQSDEQGWRWLPHVNGYAPATDPVTLRRTFEIDEQTIIPIGFFVEGPEYRLAGLVPWNRYILGAIDPSDPFFLLGSDRLGRDVYSRIVHGSRVSLSIGLIGVVMSLVIGIAFGAIAGFYGGTIDSVIQRVTEFLISLPTIPLWMGLAAAIPLTWDPIAVYFLITVILSLLGWTQLARQIRGMFMSIKNEDYVMAARLDGSGEMRVIFRHMVPAFTSHIVASVTLAVPAMILAETALSFLGIGLRSPVISWGVLLQEAQNIRTLANAAWLLWPGAAVIVAVLALNFLGDGLRDAADPYGNN